jgi:DNA-binding CsgD family transcriptional regulator
LRLACVRGSGTWGVVILHRELGGPDFAPREVDLLASLSNDLAEAFQRASIAPGLSPDAPTPRDGDRGLLLLDEEDRLEMADEAAGAWLDELRDRDAGDLPLVVAAVAHVARAAAAGRSDVVATARVRGASGRWAVVRGSVLADATRTRTAVAVEPARRPELAGFIVDAYGLTERERIVTQLVAQGLPTTAIAGRLHLSPYTVQDHLKAIFEKLGVSSRGELVATLFVDCGSVADLA